LTDRESASNELRGAGSEQRTTRLRKYIHRAAIGCSTGARKKKKKKRGSNTESTWRKMKGRGTPVNRNELRTSGSARLAHREGEWSGNIKTNVLRINYKHVCQKEPNTRTLPDFLQMVQHFTDPSHTHNV
ncbi:hypothetical protein M758_12G065300, partial [Ceratodon purpureus]